MIWEMSPLFKFEVIEMFFNTLTAADYKYAFPDCKNLQFVIQIQLP